MKTKIKIALFDQKNNVGGGERYTQKILSGFSKKSQYLEIDYLGFESQIKKNRFVSKFSKINFLNLKSLELREKGILKIYKSNKIISTLQDRLKDYTSYLPSYISGNLKKEMENRLNRYDVVLFLWPYFLDYPDIKARKIIILHDLNFKYYFSGQSTFDEKRVSFLNKSLEKWIKHSDIVVTSNFMKQEFKKFYPNFSNNLRVIRMGSFSNSRIKKNSNYKFLNYPFILCPSSTVGHKNISSLIRAFKFIKKYKKNVKLVFTGPGTDILNGIEQDDYLKFQDQNISIFGLGYISNSEIDFLIKKAAVVVNCSLYEPGNGSGLDAWKLGTPVAMSNIPAFKEHLNYLGVRAELFDPLSPKDISKKIIKILKMNKNTKKRGIQESKLKMKIIDWDLLIKDYIKFIKLK